MKNILSNSIIYYGLLISILCCLGFANIYAQTDHIESTTFLKRAGYQNTDFYATPNVALNLTMIYQRLVSNLAQNVRLKTGSYDESLSIKNEMRKRDFVYIDGSVQDADAIEAAFGEASNNKVFHLFSHGKTGELLLNGEWLSPQQVTQWLENYGYLKNKSQLNIYACNFAKGDNGRAAVKYLETRLGISVAASDDITGIDGDWELEVGSASNDIAVESYAYNLQAPIIINDTICAGESITLTSPITGANWYEWNTGESTQAITVTPFRTTIYKVTSSTGSFPSVVRYNHHFVVTVESCGETAPLCNETGCFIPVQSQPLVHFTLDQCVSDDSFAEFTATTSNNSCTNVTNASIGSTYDRNGTNPETKPLETTFSGLHACNGGWGAGDNRICFQQDVYGATYAEVQNAYNFAEVTVDPSTCGSITGFQFNLDIFEEYLGSPTKFYLRVLKDGTQIYLDENVAITNFLSAFYTFDFTNYTDFSFTTTSTFRFEFLPYAEGAANTWNMMEIDDIMIYGGCGTVIPAIPTIAATGNNPGTCGGSDGSIDFTFTNVPDGTYTINYEDASANPQTFTNVSVSSGSASVTGLSAGTYNNLSITVSGCTSVEDVDITLTEPTEPTALISSTTICNGSINMIEASPLNGSGTYSTHTWTDLGTGTATGYVLSNTNTQTLSIDAMGTGTIDLQYMVTDDANCSATITHTVTVVETDSVTICDDGSNSTTFTAQAGLTNVIWYNSADVQIGTGSMITIDHTTTGLGDGAETFYYTASEGTGCSIGLCCPIVVTLEDCGVYDWGDLPDTSSTTNTVDYQTLLANNGPRHKIISGLSLGSSVDEETEGQPSNDALGDGLDEDGLVIFASLDVYPNMTFRLPFSYLNTTGNTAHVEAWMDWNANGEFDAGEMIADWDESMGTFPNRLEAAIPSTVPTNSLIGLRIRISHQDNMTPYGLINSGEVEDYLIAIGCPQVCLPIQATVIRN